MALICSGCGKENPEEAKFCLECGTAVASACPTCGADLQADAKFCMQCGSKVGAAQSPPGESPPLRVPRDYTPKHLADKILRSKSVLEGERKQVTVLFADVKGSMDLAEQLDPEQWHQVLDQFFEILTDGVHQFEGTVNQYTGDGIMALFGAPIAHEDHARRACYAALHLRDAISEYALELRRTRGLNFAARMGINAGDVVVGKIGDDLRMDYTAQGLTVGLAQRMEQLAEPGRIYLSDNAAKIVTGYFELEDLGEFSVKGVSGPMHVFDLQGLGRLRSRLEVSQARGFSTFVGRSDEMASLDVALKHSIDGHGQVVGVVGEAGVGKSRLCYEFIQNSRANDIPVYEAHCPAHGQTIPFLPVLELWRNYFGVDDQDTPDVARTKIAGTLVLLDATFNDSLPLLFDFLGVSDPKRPAPNLDPDARQRQLIAFMRRVTKMRGEQEPSIIYIDDVHWIDPGSDQFLAQFVETMDQSRNMLLLNFRPEYHPTWSHKPFYLQLPVVPLGPEAIDELVQELLGDDSTVKTLPGLVRQRTGGNPFFIEEVIQTLVESGQLEGTRGTYRLTKSVESLQIPQTVRAILAARIDRLHEESKHVLQTAAVIGKEFIEPVLEKVVDLGTSNLSTALQALQTAEFIYEQALYPVAEYSFKHPLTQEVALDTQLQERKSRVHVAVAEAIIGASPEKLDENAALIAYHYESAGQFGEAAIWNGRAAEWVMPSDAVGGVRHWHKVFELGQEAESTEEIDRLIVTASRSILASGGWRMGMTEEEVDALRDKGAQLAMKLGDEEAGVTLDCQWAGYQSILGNTLKFVERATPVEDKLDTIQDFDSRLSSLTLLGYGFLVAGDPVRAHTYFDFCDEMTDGDVTVGLRQFGYSTHVWALGLRGWMEIVCGDLSKGIRAVEQSAKEIAKRGQTEEQCWSTAWWIYTVIVGGNDDNVAPDMERQALVAIDIADRVGSHYTAILSSATLAHSHVFCERWEEAREQAERSLELMTKYNTALEMKPMASSALARAYLGVNESEKAEQCLHPLIARYRENGSVQFTSLAFLDLAKAMLASPSAQNRRSEIDDVVELVDKVIAERKEKNMSPQVTELRARVASVFGEEPQATKLLQTAQTQYSDIGADINAARLENELPEGN